MDVDGEKLWAAMLVAASGMWVGGLLTVPLIATASARLVAPAVRTELFVVFGRRFAALMGVVMAVMLVASGASMRASSDPLAVGAMVLAAALLGSTAVGIAQARRMSSLRRAFAVDGAGGGSAVSDQGLRRNAAVATALRSLIGLLSLALLAIAIAIVAGR